MSLRSPATLLVSLSLSLASPAHAQDRSSVTVSFDQALDLGGRTPTTRGERRALEARRRGDEGIGGTAQATQLTVMPGATLAPSQGRGFELQINATQGWNLGGLGHARRRAAAEERQALTADIRLQALRARLEAARWWLALRTLERVDASLEAQEAVVRQEVSATERGVAAGVRTAPELAEAQALVARLAQERLMVEGERFDASTELAAAMGTSPPRAGAPLITEGPDPTPQLPALSTVRSRIASLDDLPEVAAARLAETAARAREAEVSAQYAPVFQAGVQVERTASDAWVLYGVLGASYAMFGQGDRARSLSRAETERAAGATEAARVGAASALARAMHEVEHSRQTVASLRNELLPSLAAALERRTRALALGEETTFAVMNARRRVLEARTTLERAEGAALWAEVHLWLLLAELEQGRART